MIASPGILGSAALVGLSLGFGLWMLVSVVPRINRPSLVSRIAPHVLDVSAEAREFVSRRTVNPLPLVGVLFGPVTSRLRRAISGFSGGSDGLARTLRQAGSSLSIDGFRSRQLSGALVGIVCAIALMTVLGQSTAFSPVAHVGLAAVGAVVGFWIPDLALKRSASGRLARLGEEFPTIVEFLTLSLSAGEGILDGLRRIARLGGGDLAGEIRSVVATVNTGVPLASALTEMSEALAVPRLSRCVEQIVGGIERGTPLAEVLRAQAQDSRDESKRDLLEIAGRKEVAMLVPVNTQMGYFLNG